MNLTPTFGKVLFTAFSVAASMVFPGSALAASKFWAGPSATTNAPVSGTWDTASTFWSDGTVNTANAIFNTGDVAIFGGADGVYGIKGSTLSAATVTFANSGYTLINDTAVTITASAGANSVNVASGKTATIGTNVTVSMTGNPGSFNAGATLGGTLIIDNGGALVQPGSLGFQIDGNGSTLRVLTGGVAAHNGGGSGFRVANTANSVATLSVEGGRVSVANSAVSIAIGNGAGANGTVNISGGSIFFTNNTTGLGANATGTGTINLNGGTLVARNFVRTGTGIFNFNGGTLKMGPNTSQAAAFMNGLTAANVRDNGGVIDYSGAGVTIGQVLQHSAIGGDASTDGGLTITNSGSAGSLTLTNANTYNGPTVVKGGAKLVTTTRSTGAGAYSVADGAILEVQVAAPGQSLTNSSLTLGTSGNLTNIFTLSTSASSTIPAMLVNGALNLNGTVSVSVSGSGLTGPGTYLLMSYGSISGSGSFVAGTLPAVGGFLASLTNDTTAKQLKLVYVAAPQPVKWAIGDGNWDTTTLNWQLLAGSGPTNYTEGSLSVFDDSATGSSPITVTLAGDRSPSSISNNATKTYIIAGSSAVTGNATITKSGSGTLVIDNSAANNFSAVAINNGTLQLGNNDANGNLGSGAVTNIGGTLALARSDNFTFNNVLSGPGAIAQNGSGNVTLGAANAHSGLTVINSGILTLGNSSAVQSSTVSNNVVNGLGFASGITAATLGGLAGAGDLTTLNADSAVVALTVGNNNQATSFGGSITGGGNFLKAGTGATTLTGSSTFGNVQTTGAGTLIISNGSSTMAALQLVADNSAVQITGGSVTVTSDSRINGSNCIFNVSGGVLSLPKMTVGALGTSSNSVMTVSGNAQVNQNSSGGTAPINQLLVGGNNGGSGTLILKDNASWNNVSTLANAVMIGNVGNGQGVLTIQDNATFFNAQVMRVADLAGNGGTVNLNGGVISVNGFSKGAGTGTINVNGGQITALAASGNFFSGFAGTGGNNSINLASGKLTFDNGGFAEVIANVLSGAGGLVSQGSGTLTLQASNTYTGGTVVNGGSLALTSAASINASSSISNNISTLDVSAANTQLSVAGALTLNNSTLIASLANTNIIVGAFDTAGSANTINITTLPSIGPIPATVHIIKYTTAGSGLVDGGNNLNALSAVLPTPGSPQGYLTNNATTKYIDLIITNYVSVPVIIGQPASDSAYAGGKAHFSVALEVTNSPGLYYQWRKAGTPLTDSGNVSGSTSTTLRLSNVSGGDAVNYDVMVTNNSGSVTSSPAALTLLLPTNYEAAAVAAGPVALYMFNETGDPSTNNTIAFDYEGDLDGIYGVNSLNAFNATAGPLPTDGFPGFDAANAAVRFQGFTANSHVTIPPLNLNTNTVTLSAWVKPGGPAANAGLIFCRGSGTVAGLNLTGNFDVNGNRTLGYTWNNEAGTFGWDSQIAPPPAIWSYVALVITPTNATIYLMNTNGLLSASQAHTHVNQSFSFNTLIGEDTANNNRQFDGTMDGVAIYAKSLTQSQLQNIYGAASGVSNFPPVITVPPANLTRYEHQTATFTVAASGSQSLSYQWKYFDGVSTYTDIVNSSRINGATGASLSISNLVLGDAGNLVVVVTNGFGAVTSSIAALTVNPTVGPATNITTSVLQGAGSDWDTDGTWSLPGSATDLSGQYFGSTFTILANGGLRTPNFGNPGSATTASFPGDVLRVEGNGTFDTSLTVAGAIRIKGGNPATVNFKKLVMAGGQISSILNSGQSAILTGEVNVISNTVVWAADDTSPRSINIQSTLTGDGNIMFEGYNTFTTLQTGSGASLNIANANNPYTGTWNVPLGSLVGSAVNALGTNTITVGAQGALQTTYDINNPNGTLVLNGRMYLTQNDTFQNVIINGTALNGGTYSFATLAANYPANFPSTWTPLNGALTATNATGSITVLASTIAPYPTNITFSVSGSTLSLTWPGTHLGWLAQSNSVDLANSNFWFDITGSQAATNLNITISPAQPKVFYRLRHP